MDLELPIFIDPLLEEWNREDPKGLQRELTLVELMGVEEYLKRPLFLEDS